MLLSGSEVLVGALMGGEVVLLKGMEVSLDGEEVLVEGMEVSLVGEDVLVEGM